MRVHSSALQTAAIIQVLASATSKWTSWSWCQLMCRLYGNLALSAFRALVSFAQRALGSSSMTQLVTLVQLLLLYLWSLSRRLPLPTLLPGYRRALQPPVPAPPRSQHRSSCWCLLYMLVGLQEECGRFRRALLCPLPVNPLPRGCWVLSRALVCPTPAPPRPR